MARSHFQTAGRKELTETVPPTWVGLREPGRKLGRRSWGILLIQMVSSGALGCGSAALERQQHEQRQWQQEATVSALMRKGEMAAAVGDMTRAEQYLVLAEKAGGDQKQIIRRLLAVCVADERYPVAADYAEEYLERHPQDVGVAFAAASIYSAAGETDHARKLLEAVIQKRPDWSEPHFALATILREQGESSESADIHDLKYLKLSPNGPLAEQARARLSRTAP